MPLILPATFLVVVTLESLLLGTLLLWWSCRWLKLPPITVRRALGTNLALILAGGVAQATLALLAFLPASRWINPTLQTAMVLALLAAHVFVQCAIIARLLHASGGKAFLAWLMATVPVAIVGMALAFATKATLVEAFVVPTGAMAPTVLGAHADRICENCGFSYAVGLSERVPPDGVDRAKWRAHVEPLRTFCPNCRRPDEVAVDAPIVSGDRILVDKQVMPRRWEVFVFRYPEDRATNFVKRLVGLPGETLEIVLGEVFIDGKQLQKSPGTAQDLWFHVHDTAFRPARGAAGGPRWTPAEENSNWVEQDGCWINGGQAQRDSLEYTGPVNDRMAYNADRTKDAFADEDAYNVGDVLVACDLAAFAGEGRLALNWQFRGEFVEIAISPAGKVEIQAVSPGGGDDDQRRERSAGKLAMPLRPLDRLGFAVRDGQAYLVHNDQLALLLPFGSPDIEAAKARSPERTGSCRIALMADSCRISLNRIVLVRDVYFRGGDADDDLFGGRLRGSIDRPVTLSETEYFALGDNSVRSKDSRFYGDLQAPDILGTARWIYWPQKRWRAFR